MSTQIESSLGRSPHFGAHRHDVQFYEREDFLYTAVADYLAEGVNAGEPGVVVATPEHRAGFAEALRMRGLDPANIDVLFLDARETLAKFMSGSMPDPQRFFSTIGAVLEAHKAVRLRAYGEMVDVLWRDGNREGAVRLEELWNEIAGFYSFSLLCAYPIGNFLKESDATLFDAICARHNRTLPTERYAMASGEERATEIVRLQQRAQALEAEIEHRKHLEKALRDALRAKDEFLATLSHELRTPLTAIFGWARMLSMGGLDPEVARTAIETIERSAKTQATLIDDILDLSRVVTGKMSLRHELVEMGSVVANAVQTLQLAADAKDISIEIARPEENVLVNGDPTRLQQIAWNLLSNAIKFSRGGAIVSAAIERRDGDATLVVRDTGRGIDPGFLPHVFEPFRQADGTTTRTHGGLGLGLAIVKYLTEMHGGTVRAESDGPDRGAKFTVTLPLASA